MMRTAKPQFYTQHRSLAREERVHLNDAVVTSVYAVTNWLRQNVRTALYIEDYTSEYTGEELADLILDHFLFEGEFQASVDQTTGKGK